MTDDERPTFDEPDLRAVLAQLEERARSQWPGLLQRLRRALPGPLEDLAGLADLPDLQAMETLVDRAENIRDERDALADQLRDAREAIHRLHSVEGLADAIGQLDDDELGALADRVGRLDARASVGDDRGSRP